LKTRILTYFAENPDEFVSGEKISKELNVSRAAIWKHMQALKAEGYEFESQSRRGYRLIGVPADRVTGEAVALLLKTKYLGRNYYYAEQVNTTNQWAKELANDGAADGTVVVAEEQVAGKGRLQRGWFSPPNKGMWLSMILRPEFLPQEAPKMTLLIAVAIAKVLNQRGIPAGIKWPNDVLLGERKIVGILTELSAEMERIHHVVVGVGLNINVTEEDLPEEIREVAGSLFMYTRKMWDRAELIADFLLEVEYLYEGVKKSGFDEVFSLWKEMSITLGAEVRVIFGEQSYEGKAVDLDASGALWIEKPDGTRELVQAGDVSIRGLKR